MAEITFACTGCKQELEAPAEMAGEVVECPNCQQQIAIPDNKEPASKISVAAALSSMSTPDSTPPKAASQCPDCGANMIPDSVLCLQCGFNVKLGRKMTTELS